MARYLVFARDRYEEPLELHGDCEADDDEAAAGSARDALPERDWIEILLVPDDAIRWIVRPAKAGQEAANA